MRDSGIETPLRIRWRARLLDVGTSLADALRVAAVVAHPLRHWQLHRSFRHPSVREFGAGNIRLGFKYLVEYASRSLSTAQRYELLTAHYSLLSKRLAPGFFTAINESGLFVWEQSRSDHTLAIILDFPRPMQTEGDLCLTLRMDGVAAYRLIFVIGCGRSFGVAADHVVLVTCVQGLLAPAQLKLISSICVDVHPSDLLMAALAGFAGSVRIGTVLGITTQDQIANTGRIYFSYDDFFAKYGRRSSTFNGHEIALPFTQHDVVRTPANHRGRKRAKRAMRNCVRNSVLETLTQFLLEDPTVADGAIPELPSALPHGLPTPNAARAGAGPLFDDGVEASSFSTLPGRESAKLEAVIGVEQERL